MMTVRAGCFTLRTKHYVCSNRCVPVGTTSAAGTPGKMIVPPQLLNLCSCSLFLIARCPVQEVRHHKEFRAHIASNAVVRIVAVCAHFHWTVIAAGAGPVLSPAPVQR